MNERKELTVMDEMHVLWNGTEARDRGSDIVKAQPEYTAPEYRWERNVR